MMSHSCHDVATADQTRDLIRLRGKRCIPRFSDKPRVRNASRTVPKLLGEVAPPSARLGCTIRVRFDGRSSGTSQSSLRTFRPFKDQSACDGADLGESVPRNWRNDSPWCETSGHEHFRADSRRRAIEVLAMPRVHPSNKVPSWLGEPLDFGSTKNLTNSLMRWWMRMLAISCGRLLAASLVAGKTSGLAQTVARQIWLICSWRCETTKPQFCRFCTS